MTTREQKTPELWTLLYDDESGGASIVVPEGTSPLAALVALVEEEYGGRFSDDNSVLVKEVEGLKVEVWRSCSQAYLDDRGIEGQNYWAPDGDGDLTIHVLHYQGDSYALGDRASDVEDACP